jgi:hypothetical protein
MMRGKLVSGDHTDAARRAKKARCVHRRAPLARGAPERRKKVRNMECGCGVLFRTLRN